MKDEFKKIILILICFILCACSVKNENTLTIEKNGELKYNVLIAFDKSIIDSLSKMNIIKNEEDINEYVSENIKDDYLNGFVKTEYKDNEYIGNEYIYEVSNIEDVTTTNNIAVTLNNSSVVEKDMFTKENDVYIANFLYNLENKYNYEDVDFENTFTVNLPFKALSSNADKVLNNGKTLIWNIENGESKAINFKFKFIGVKAYISLGLLIFDIILVVLIITLYIRSKKNEKEVV